MFALKRFLKRERRLRAAILGFVTDLICQYLALTARLIVVIAWVRIGSIKTQVRTMAQKKIIHVVGTGTIGEPLIGILCTFKEQFGIDEVTFHKRTPLLTDRSKVMVLGNKGAKLSVDKERWQKFAEMGMTPTYEAEEAIERASVVVDCTPVGNDNKEKLYNKYANNGRGFIAQGSEYGFGKMYARGINDKALVQRRGSVHSGCELQHSQPRRAHRYHSVRTGKGRQLRRKPLRVHAPGKRHQPGRRFHTGA